MKKILQLNLGYSDAENYKIRKNKEFFNKVFLKTDELRRLTSGAVTFLVGEKGTGKTAYATFLANNDIDETLSDIKFIRETEYQKFVALKKARHLELSDYTNIWKVILLLLMSQKVRKSEPRTKLFDKFTKFDALNNAIDEYYANAFAPEIINAIQFVDETKLAAELLQKYATISAGVKRTESFQESRFQINLRYIQNQFEGALGQLRLSKNHILFIDGIDIRPQEIGYRNYIDCIRGLANAVWSLNQDVFSQFRDTKGRMRIVLLIRPDIFESLGLQNQNTKLLDNSILLDWRTTYPEHRYSNIFKATDRILSEGQDGVLQSGQSWDHYFPFDSSNIETKIDGTSSFVGFLRFSLYRPRDILTMLNILQGNVREKGPEDKAQFSAEDFDHPDFRRKYAQYLLGEVKDQLLFYYSSDEYELFLRFFEHLNGKQKFTYEEYEEAYRSVLGFLKGQRQKIPHFLRGAGDFLQFLYTLNVISFLEQAEDGSSYIRWNFRERSYANIVPKVKVGTTYEIHYGLVRALNLGKKMQKRYKGRRN